MARAHPFRRIAWASVGLAGILLLGACGPAPAAPDGPDELVARDATGDDGVDAWGSTGILVALNAAIFTEGSHSVRMRLYSPDSPAREVVRELDQPLVLLYVDTLAPGTWLLLLEVLDPNGNTVFCGSRYVSILAGATTRADVLLSPSGPCVPTESACSDGSDDDFDGDTDCADDDCAGQSCNDGSQCTLGDACTGGVCVGATPLTCDDGQPCTNDSCAAATGCVFTPIAGCGGGCTSDAECNDQGLCQGAGCAQCTADHCVDGVCENDPLSGTPCDDADPCTSGDTCSAGLCAGTTITPGGGPTELCNGEDDDCDAQIDEPFGVGDACTDAPAYNECRTYERACSGDQQSSVCSAVGLKSNATPCGVAQCSNGVLVAGGGCLNGNCIIAQPQACAPYLCADGTQCATSCQDDSGCAAGYSCDNGTCVIGSVLGDPCDDDSQCLSDHCADNVCCEDACEGPCRACDESGACILVQTQTDPQDECPGSCDVSGDYVDGVCGATGECEEEIGAATDCGAYLCADDGCLTTCSPSGPQCANGVTCVNNTCCDGGVDLDGGLVTLSVPVTGVQEFTLCVGSPDGVAFSYTGISKQIRRVLLDPQGTAVEDNFIGPGNIPEDLEPSVVSNILRPPGLYHLQLSQVGQGTGPVTGNLRMYAIPSPGGGLASLDGTPVGNTTVTVPGQDVVVTYPGVAGKYLAIRIAGLPSFVTRTDPDGFLIAGGGIITTPAFLDATFVPKTGTYTMRFDPLQIATGAMTLQYWDVPPDLEATATTDGTEVQQTITIPGRDAGVSFTGAAGTHVSIAVECPKSVLVVLRKSTGEQVGGATTGTEGLFKAHLDNLTLPTSGTYRIDIDLVNDAAYDHPETIRTRVYAWTSDALATVPIDVATPVPAPYPGQRLQVLFDATAGTTVSALLAYTGCAFPDPIMNDPVGTQVGATDFYGACDGAFIPPVSIGQSGTYRIIVDFFGSDPVAPTVTIFDVTTRPSVDTTINGAAVGLPITKAGEVGEVTFSGTSAQVVRLRVSGTAITGTTSYKIVRPSGSDKQSFSQFGTFTGSAVTLDETGTWKIVVDPESRFTGTQTISVISP